MPTPLQLGTLSAAAGPLYQQIVDGIKKEIAAGRLLAGSALPSFRALAEELLVSLITVKRAYEDLEREGIIYRRQGLGTFVAENGVDVSRAGHEVAARVALRTAMQEGRQAGLSDRALLQLLKQELEQRRP